MSHNDRSRRFPSKFNRCSRLDRMVRCADIATERETTEKDRTTLNIWSSKLLDVHAGTVQLASFCGLWEDYPDHRYRMEFRLEFDQLVGRSNVDGGKATISLAGKLITMVITHTKEPCCPMHHYQGRLGLNQRYISWMKKDSSRSNTWHPTRKWIKIA